MYRTFLGATKVRLYDCGHGHHHCLGPRACLRDVPEFCETISVVNDALMELKESDREA